MKKKSDPRHLARQKIIQELFSYSFSKKQDQDFSSKTQEIIKNLSKINPKIKKAAPEFPIDRLNKIDLAILRLAIFELIINKKEPFRVIIDEAIELSKEFGSENSPQFINGALGAIVNNFQPRADRPLDKKN